MEHARLRGVTQQIAAAAARLAVVLCESFSVRGGRVVVPDVLIVLDRSSSTKHAEVNRWDPSVSGPHRSRLATPTVVL